MTHALDPRLSPDAAQVLIELQIAAGLRCPECDSCDTESNGAREYRCCLCDHRWGNDPERYGY